MKTVINIWEDFYLLVMLIKGNLTHKSEGNFSLENSSALIVFSPILIYGGHCIT